MPPRFDPETNPENPEDSSKVDVTKRYDVYSFDFGAHLVVYRNVRFVRLRTLFSQRIIELEQSNGQSVFIGIHSMLRFCEHGTDLSVEFIERK